MPEMVRKAMSLVGLVALALAVAHCGDNNNNNENISPTRTPASNVTPATKTPTPGVSPSVTSTSETGTPSETSTGGTPTSPTATSTPSSGDLCPTAISFLGNEQTARLDTGWTGLAHDSRIISGGEVTVSTDCGGNPRPCGVCNLTGPIRNPDVGQGISNNQRCSNDTSTECTSNADCTGTNAVCAFFFGPPLPLSAGGVSTCVTNQVIGTITGTANIETGESANTTKLTSRVFSATLQTQPCPICQGDTTPGDGQKNGTCSDGPRAGQPCDISGTSPTFDPLGSTSFDCPPASTAQIGALPILLPTSTSVTTRTLSADSPNCGASAGNKCFCDTCTSAAAEPCFSNADCPSGAQCGGKRCRGGPSNGMPCSTGSQCPPATGGSVGVCSSLGQATQPNACADGVCSPVSGSTTNGECAGGPVFRFCSPHDTFIGCASDSECHFAGDTCTGAENQACFLDNGAVGGNVTATGIADVPVNGVAHPTLASLFCIPPTSAPAVNTAAGLPGLGRLQLSGTATERH